MRMTLTMRTAQLSAGLMGGVAWVANLFVDSDALSVIGTVLLGLAVLVVGGRQARQTWLSVITAAGSVALFWSLLELLRDVYDDRVLEAVLGGVASLVVAIVVARSPGGSGLDRAVAKRGNHRG